MADTAAADDLRYMRAALALGRRSMGQAAPNPAVGALVVKDGIVLGRGVTAAGGRPHAEPLALAEAGAGARGATLYVTLEPCSHHGKTPPCVDAVLASGVARVVVALADPDPRVSGRGLARLRDAGVDVTLGVAAEDACEDHRGHILRATRGRPLVTLKMAETADGYAGAPAGEARLLITGPRAEAHVHMLRARHDAVLIGAGTARADDPQLTVRLPGFAGPQPRRVVLDPRLTLSPASRLAAAATAVPVLVIAAGSASGKAERDLTRRGVEVARLPDVRGRFELAAVLAVLAQRGLTRILCEGGPHLASALIDDGLADRVVLIAGKAVHGRQAVPSFSPRARARLFDPSCYRRHDEADWGTDRMLLLRRADASCSPDL